MCPKSEVFSQFSSSLHAIFSPPPLSSPTSPPTISSLFLIHAPVVYISIRSIGTDLACGRIQWGVDWD